MLLVYLFFYKIPIYVILLQTLYHFYCHFQVLSLPLLLCFFPFSPSPLVKVAQSCLTLWPHGPHFCLCAPLSSFLPSLVTWSRASLLLLFLLSGSKWWHSSRSYSRLTSLKSNLLKMCPGSVNLLNQIHQKQTPWKKQTFNMNYWILSTWKSLRPTSVFNKYLWRKWVAWSACGRKCMFLVCTLGLLNQNHSVSGIWEPKFLLFYHMIFHPIPSPHSSFFSALRHLSRTQPLLRLSQISFIMPSHRTLSSVKLTVTLILHICVRLLNEVLSLLPVCLQSYRFLFNIISLLLHLNLTHCGPSINVSEWIHICNMDWKWKV